MHFPVTGLNTAFNTGIENVFAADDNQRPGSARTPENALWYTFRRHLVTCPKCLEALKELRP